MSDEPDLVQPAPATQPLAWSRDVTVIGLAEPGELDVLPQVAAELCEGLTLKGNAEAAWLAALTRLEYALAVQGYAVREALLATSDGHWGAAVKPRRQPQPAVTQAATALLVPLVPLAWQMWRRGAGLDLAPEAEALASPPEPNAAPRPPLAAQPEPKWDALREQAIPGGDEAPAPPGPEARTDPLEPDRAAAATEDDAGVAPAVGDAGREAGSRHAGNARVAMLLRLADGSFRGAWLSAWLASSAGPTEWREAVVGQRLFVGVHGAAVAIAPAGHAPEPSAASRAYERLLQPGTAMPAAIVVLTAASFDVHEARGVVVLSSRGAAAGNCRIVDEVQTP